MSVCPAAAATVPVLKPMELVSGGPVKVARNVPSVKFIVGVALTAVEPLSSSVPLWPTVIKAVAWRLLPGA